MESDVHQRLVQLTEQYRMPARARKLVMASELLVICGVTAAGKNTIVKYLTDNDNFTSIVSHTTRKPRRNHGILEQNGQDYCFVDEPEMLKLAEDQAFVEFKPVHGMTFYGTSILSIERAVKSDKRPITEIDVNGVLELMAELPKLRPLFVLPPSYEIWMERLGGRGGIDNNELKLRLISAKAELELAIKNFQFGLVVNHEFRNTVQEIMQGVDLSTKVQDERRQLARSLLDAIKS